VISALVIVRSASGRDLRAGEPVTSENIADYTPAPGVGTAVRDWFRQAGFDSGEVVGPTFSITARIEAFEDTFGVAVHPAEGGGFVAAAPDGVHGTYELPLDRLPGGLAELVLAVTFEPPAETFSEKDATPWL
jgi:hypothetical protein